VAILIQINRVADFPDAAVYEFGPVDGIVGQVSVDKSSGQVELFDITPQVVGRDVLPYAGGEDIGPAPRQWGAPGTDQLRGVVIGQRKPPH
jgi:hypothetical protein